MPGNRTGFVSGLISVCVLVFLSACRASEQPATSQLSTSEVYSSVPPFKTLEPERYQAVRTSIFTDASGGTTTSKSFIAKDGPLRREEISDSEGKRVVYLDLPEGVFLVLPDSRIYADTSEKNESAASLPDVLSLEDSLGRSLHAGASESRYQQLGPEAVGGRLTNKYRVVVNNSLAENVSNTETWVWVDEELSLPIKTETSSNNGNRMVTELSEINRNVDKTLFQVPVGYTKVAADVLRRQLEKHD